MNTGIILMSRIPQAGLTKTRLEVCLTPGQCADFHRACLHDELSELKGLPWPKYFCYTDELDFDQTLSVSQLGAACGLTSDLLESWTVIKQQGQDLGERMQNAAQAVLEMMDAVIIIGSDMPWLTKARIIEAAAELENQDVVIGPSEDGGYYLLGLKNINECLFKGIPWSTDQVFSYTQAIIADHNLSAGLLAVEYDLDTSADLACFWRQAQVQPQLKRLKSYQFLEKISAEEKGI